MTGWHRFSAWIWLAAALIVIVAIGIASAKPPPGPALQTGNAEPNGGLALYLWLQRLGYQVRATTNSSETQRLSPHSTLMILVPGVQFSRGQTAGIVRWVSEGGRLVLTNEGENSGILRALRVRVSAIGGELSVLSLFSNLRVVQPLLLAPPAAKLVGVPSAVVSSGEGVAVAEGPSGPVLWYRPLGRGSIWLLTDRDVLDNSHLAQADNRRLLLDLAGPGRRIVFDEGAESTATGQPDWLTGTVAGIAILFALAVLLLYRWLSGWRLGPALSPLHDRYRPASEYVVSMAGLLHRAHKRREVLERYQRALRRTLAPHDTAASNDLPLAERADLDALLAPVDTLSEEQLIRRAREIVEWMTESRSAHV